MEEGVRPRLIGGPLTRMLAVLAIEVVAAAAIGMVALDLWAHRRVEQLGGVNVWGYRGSVLPQKRQGEVRVAIVGGDIAFGWGQSAGGTLASEVRRLVMLETDRPGRPLHPVTGVNLAAQGLRPGEYGAWIERFSSLGLDVVTIVADPPGYRSRRAHAVPDRQSGIFALSGYVPMLPLVLQEKGAIARSGVLTGAGRLLAAADHRVAGFAGGTPQPEPSYADALAAGIGAGRRAGAAVVLVLPPHHGPDDGPRYDPVRAMVAARSAADASVRLVDLHDDPGLSAAAMRLNDVDFASAGIARAAQSIAPPVTDLVRAVIE